MTVHFETEGPIAVVTIDRPAVANAVDRETANALVAAFERFDADPALHVAILTGAGGKFCAGGDLKAIATGQGSIGVSTDGAGPLGPTRMMLSKPVIAAVEGPPSPVVWSSRSGVTCESPPATRRSASTAGAGAFRFATAGPCGCRA
jgi:1,4-dihydroxy-2-naphthoyl-CoA synthase